MIKRLLAVLAAFFALSMSAFAADVNTASQADLDAVKGIGPATATKILDERKKGNFKDWPDLIARVKGIGDKNAAKLSDGGLTVNGATFSGAPAPAAKAAPAAPAAKPAPAAAATTAAPATKAAPAAAATPAATTTPAAAPAASTAKQSKKDRKAAAAASAASAAKK